LQQDLTDNSFVIMKKLFFKVWKVISRIRGFSVPVVGGGLQWKDDPSLAQIEKVVEEFIRLHDDPHTKLDPPLILRAGGATLKKNSELEQACSRIQMRGYQHPLNVWLKRGILIGEMLDFLKWQISDTRAAKTVLSDMERDEAIARFRKCKDGS
jgi:hypothetical protein